MVKIWAKDCMEDTLEFFEVLRVRITGLETGEEPFILGHSPCSALSVEFHTNFSIPRLA
jgi:hypothetical protein